MTREDALKQSRIHYLPFPDDIYGVVQPCKDGKNIIAINSNLPPKAQKKALEHELAHIYLDHFNSNTDLRTIEAEAEQYAGGACNA